MATFTSRNKDGSPRKLRKATHPRSKQRQGRMIMEAKLGRKLATTEIVHHEESLDNPHKLRIVRGNKGHHHAKRNSAMAQGRRYNGPRTSGGPNDGYSPDKGKKVRRRR